MEGTDLKLPNVKCIQNANGAEIVKSFDGFRLVEAQEEQKERMQTNTTHRKTNVMTPSNEKRMRNDWNKIL